MIKVSVIIPVYNASRFLCECLDSVLSQTLKEIEVICVDDASDDNSPEILHDYAAKDSRLTVLQQETNQFAGAARNRGIKQARGKYLLFLDADDFFEQDMLERMFRQCEQDNADVCVCGAQIYDMAERRLVAAGQCLNLSRIPSFTPFSCRDIPETIFLFTTPAPWNKLFRAEFVRREGLLFQVVQRSNDFCFVLTALAVAHRITVVDRIPVCYRRGTATSLQETNDNSPYDFYLALLALKENLVSRDLFPLLEKAFVMRALDSCIYNLTIAKTKEGWLRIALRLKDEILPGLGCDQYPASAYHSGARYQAMRFLLDSTHQELAEHQPNLRKDETSNLFQIPVYNIPDDGTIKVSVIIPVYNVETYIEECVRSVMRQSLRDIEILCVNDGSGDRSSLILEQLQKEDDRIRIINQENAGPSVARNTALDAARGEYIAFLDSDDCYQWCTLEHLYRHAKAYDLDQLFYEGNAFYESIDLYQIHAHFRTYYTYKQAYPVALNGQALFVCLKAAGDFKPSGALQFIRRRFLDDNGLRFYPGILHEDNLLTLQCLMVARRAKVLKEPLYLRRVRVESIMTADKSLAHVYGYWMSLYESRRSLAAMHITNQAYLAAMAEDRVRMTNQMRKAMENLDEAHIRAYAGSFPQDQQLAFIELLGLTNQTESAKKRLEIRTAQLQKKDRSFKALEKKHRALEKKYKALEKKYRTLEKKQKTMGKKVKKLQKSFSYRLGRALTAPARWIRRLFGR